MKAAEDKIRDIKLGFLINSFSKIIIKGGVEKKSTNIINHELMVKRNEQKKRKILG